MHFPAMWNLPAHPPTAGQPGHPHVLAAEGGTLSSIEDAINSAFEPISTAVTNFIMGDITLFGVTFPWIMAWLVVAATILTLYFGFIQFRAVPLALALIRGKHTSSDDPGEISHFRALASALSSTIGLGNIAGVGVAVTIGGPGATFWMIVCGLLGMCSKFVECTLAVRYREIHEDGTVSGGPFHYLRKGIAERIPNAFGTAFGKVVAALSAVMILLFALSGGTMFQANQTFAQIRNVTGGDEGPLGTDGAAFIFGVLLALLVGVVIIGGIKSIGAVTGRLVPAMSIIYIAACLFVIGVNYDKIPSAFGSIVEGAFSPEAGFGGVIGVVIVGFQRAAFSNEAGVGSSPIAHSAVKTRYPATEGLVALLEPFVDTVVICTMTALTIVIANTELWRQGMQTAIEGGTEPDGVIVTSDAFATFVPWFPYVLTLAVFLFAFSTILTWGYYGQKAWTHLFGKSRTSERVYQIFFCCLIVVGSVLTLGTVLDFADAVLFGSALFNVIGLYLLAPYVKQEVRSFRDKVRSGRTKEPEEAH